MTQAPDLISSLKLNLGRRHIVGPLNAYSLLALAGMIGPIVLVVTDISAARLEPGYSYLQHSISSLALTRMGWVQTIGFLAIGLMVEIFVAGLFLGIRGSGLSIGLLVGYGFGLLLIGAFRTDPVGAQRTIDGTIHGLTATTIFWMFPVAILLLAPILRRDRHWKDVFVYTVVTGAIALGLIGVQIFRRPEQMSFFGLYERILVLNTIAWVEVIAFKLFRLSLRQPEAALPDVIWNEPEP